MSRNPLRYFDNRYNLKIKPMETVRALTMIAESRKVTIRGHLGYIFNRGAERTSLELQLFNQIEAELYMDTYIIDTMVDDIARQFDAVVIATGTSDIPDYYGIVADTRITAIRSGIMEGKYEPGKIVSWMKTEYSENSYIYLLPISKTKAMLTLMADNTSMNDLDFKWKQMIARESIRDNFLETWDSEFYSCKLYTNRLGNIYFIGTAGGMTDDFVGFGIINAITAGIYTAEAIVQEKSFERSIEPILKQVDHLHNLRLMANKMDKREWKRLITLAGAPGVRHMVYKHPIVKFHHIGAMAGIFYRHT